jgi:hypothetical protein
MRRNRIVAQVAQSELNLGALAQVLPPALVCEVLAGAGKAAKRVRKLPPDLVAWLVVAMGVFRGLSITNVLAQIAETFGATVRWGSAELPHATAIAEARDRLGWEVMRTLFSRLGAALSQKHESAARWRGLVVRALDGCTFLAPDSKANEREFGRPGTSRGGAKSGFPQVRAVFVLGVFTHVVTQIVFAPYRDHSELKTAQELAGGLERGTLVLMDRLYYSFAWLSGLVSRHVHVLVRAKTGRGALKPKTKRRLADGSALAVLRVPRNLRSRPLPREIEVRVIRYRAKGFRPMLLVTTLLSPEAYPADEVGALYHDRWEIELGCREIKTYQVGVRVAFRSKTPSRVLQEAYGLFVAYNCIRGLMADAAALRGVEPRRLSFVSCLHRIRAATIAFNGDARAAYERLIDDLARCPTDPRRVGRRCPRAVKVKMSKWPRKRPGLKTVATSRPRRSAAR